MGNIQTFKLPELVDYQEGSVVSKTLVKKEAGTVTIFAFDKGQGLSEHTAPFDVFVTILEGEADYTRDGQISFNEWEIYVKRTVRSMTNGRQSPVSYKPLTWRDFPVAQVPERDRMIR